MWVSAKTAGSGVVYLAVIAVLGGVAGPGIVLSLLAAVLTCAAVAALITAFAATIENEGSSFTALFRFVVIPMTLFSGYSIIPGLIYTNIYIVAMLSAVKKSGAFLVYSGLHPEPGAI